MSTQEIVIPDIGAFDDVDVIEVLVNVGDTIKTDDPLLTLETEKAVSYTHLTLPTILRV